MLLAAVGGEERPEIDDDKLAGIVYNQREKDCIQLVSSRRDKNRRFRRCQKRETSVDTVAGYPSNEKVWKWEGYEDNKGKTWVERSIYKDIVVIERKRTGGPGNKD